MRSFPSSCRLCTTAEDVARRRARFRPAKKHEEIQVCLAIPAGRACWPKGGCGVSPPLWSPALGWLNRLRCVRPIH